MDDVDNQRSSHLHRCRNFRVGGERVNGVVRFQRRPRTLLCRASLPPSTPLVPPHASCSGTATSLHTRGGACRSSRRRDDLVLCQTELAALSATRREEGAAFVPTRTQSFTSPPPTTPLHTPSHPSRNAVLICKPSAATVICCTSTR